MNVMTFSGVIPSILATTGGVMYIIGRPAR